MDRREKCTFNVVIIGVVCGNSKLSSQPTWIRMPSLPFRVRLVRKKSEYGPIEPRARRGPPIPHDNRIVSVVTTKLRRGRGTKWIAERHFTCCRRCRNAHQCRPACRHQQLDTRPGSADPQTSIPGFLWSQTRIEPGPIMMSPTCVASFRDGASYAKGDPSVVAAGTRRRLHSRQAARF